MPFTGFTMTNRIRMAWARYVAKSSRSGMLLEPCSNCKVTLSIFNTGRFTQFQFCLCEKLSGYTFVRERTIARRLAEREN